MNELFRTIAAISTPRGKGGIAVIRVSGQDATQICGRVFFPLGKKSISKLAHARAFRGEIKYNGKIIDDGLITVFRAPHSFTGEDVCEISCHGGILLADRILEALFAAGAVPAEAGEFTKRAFINGKVSLSGAESIIDSIDAETDNKLILARSMRRGVLSAETGKYAERIKKAISSVYAYADYPDEDMRDMSTPELKEEIEDIASSLVRLAETYRTGHAINEGIKTVIAGKPNVGKSSLLNRLLGTERAIVTDLPGTTRDTIEETVECGGALLRLTDTAGIRATEDEVEKIGVGRALEKLRDAELILALFDSSRPANEDDEKLLAILANTDARVINILNKCDLERRFDVGLEDPISICAESGDGIEDIKKKISSLFIDGDISLENDAVVANARQSAALHSAIDALSAASAAIEGGFGEDTACLDLEYALSALTGLDGRGVGEAVVDDIFSRFCVGK